MCASVALVTDADDVAALLEAGIGGDVRVIALTLRARLAARRAGVTYDTLDQCTSRLNRRAILTDARRFADSWHEQPFVARSTALGSLANWRGYPLLAMQRRHLFDWFAEALSALAVARCIVELGDVAAVWLADRASPPPYWCMPAENWDAAALALVAEQRGVPVHRLGSPPPGALSLGRVRNWIRSALRTRTGASEREDERSPRSGLAPANTFQHVAGRRVLILAHGHHYWQLMEACALALAECVDVVLAPHTPLDSATVSRLDGAGVRIVDLPALLHADVSCVRRAGLAALEEVDGDANARRFFTDAEGTPFWPLMRRKFVTLFESDVPQTARHLVAAERLLNEHAPDLLLAALCESGLDAAYPIAARACGIPSVTLQHGLILDGNADGTLAAADVVGVWGRLTQSQLQRGGDTRRDRFPVVGCPAPLRSAGGIDVLPRLGLRDGPPVCLFLGALGWAGNDVNRYAEEAILTAVLDLAEQVEGLQLIMRLHAGEDVTSLRELAAERGSRAVVQPDATLEELLAASDIVVTQTTTAGLWAMRAGLPVVYLNARSERDWLPFATSGAALGVYRIEDLSAAVRRALDDAELRRRLTERADVLISDALNAIGPFAASQLSQLCCRLMEGHPKAEVATTAGAADAVAWG